MRTGRVDGWSLLHCMQTSRGQSVEEKKSPDLERHHWMGINFKEGRGENGGKGKVA